MNILPCLVLCVAFASCLSNESADTAVDANSGIFYNSTLHEYLSQHKNLNQALYHTYKVLKALLTGRITLNLMALAKYAAKGQNASIMLRKLNLFARLACYEHQCYCNFYVKKIWWIKEALQQGNYSTADIMESIVLLGGYVRPLAVQCFRWHERVKGAQERGAKKTLPELNMLAVILENLEKLERGLWAVTYTYMLKHEEQAELVKRRIAEDHSAYVDAFYQLMESYETNKMELMKRGDERFASVLEDNFLAEFTEHIVNPGEKLQASLKKIEPGAPLGLPGDTKEEEKKILDMVLNGTAKKFEGTAAKTAAKEPASAIEGAESGAKKDSPGKTSQEPLLVGSETKNESKLAVDQSELHGAGTGEMGAKIDVEDKAGKKTSKQRPQQETKTKTKTKTKLQEKKDAKGEAKKEEGEMLEHAGGTKSKREKIPRRFVELFKKFEEGRERMTYREVRELFASPVLLELGISTGCLLGIDKPHGKFGWDDYISWEARGICNTKWDSFKSHDNYAELLKKIEECMWEK